MKFELKSFIRGKSADLISSEAKVAFCQLSSGQPLLLSREPNNPVDSAAVLASDLYGAPCGYVAREHAPQIAGLMDNGWVLMAKAVGGCMCVYRRIYIWCDGEEEVEVEQRFKINRTDKKRNRIKETIE